MAHTRIPAYCPSCGAIFASCLPSMIGIGGNVTNLTLSGNKETCPFCGGWADTAEGVFNVANNVLSVVSAPTVTKQMLVAFEAAVRKAYLEKTPPETLAKEVETIDPSFGEAVRKSANSSFYIVFLLLILAAIKSCSVDVKLDVNRLIEQIQGKPPAVVVTQQQNAK